jgi:hypothetical protein
MRLMADLQTERFIPHVEPTDALTTAIMTQTRTIALIGTSHKYQRPGHPAEGEFRSLINQVCASLKVRAIAEEMSAEALEQKKTSQSLCEEIAKATGSSHLYCDPNNAQRKALNIRGKQDIEWEGFCCDWSPERVEEEVAASHTIRERYWLTQLLQLDSWPVLFELWPEVGDGVTG